MTKKFQDVNITNNLLEFEYPMSNKNDQKWS
jgi:hypothetical protein